ncbi:MAG: hypothetical protein ACOCP8_05285 [archaeon]
MFELLFSSETLSYSRFMLFFWSGLPFMLIIVAYILDRKEDK